MSEVEGVEDIDSILSKSIALQRNRLETLGIVSAISLVMAAAWYVWPGIDGRAEFLPRFGPGIILMVLALAMQDFVDYGPKHRSRLGSLTAAAWAPMLLLGVTSFDTELETSVRLGHGLLGLIGLSCYLFSTSVLTGSLQAVRFRGLVQLLGATSATALLLSNPSEGVVMLTSSGICVLAFGVALFDIFGKDPDREERKKFKKLRDSLELRILELRAKGIQVDQAASLLQNAIEVGYTDPSEAMTILHLAEDDIERTLAMSSDITDIREDAAKAVSEADDIAPTAKKAMRLLKQGDREMELGSLRDAEMLFRKAKTHAGEIIEFWTQAETAISDAKRALSGCEGVQFDPLFSSVKNAEEALEREAPAEAAGLVMAVPEHVENLGETESGAEEVVEEASRAVKAASGIDDTDFAARIKQASNALKEGNFSLARGMADSVIREVTREAEAMVEVQKAWRHRKKLVAQWSDWANAKEWDTRLAEVGNSRKEKQWSHAAMLLENITRELDAESAQTGEATELLEFLQGEWRGVRDRLQAAGIKVNDAERNACEAAIGEAVAALDKGDIDTCLGKLGEADQMMEALRRRI
jgi:hypothetical protein